MAGERKPDAVKHLTNK
jgi:hypothetical protein